MKPDGTFLKDLNKGKRDDKRYFVISSNFEPKNNPGFKVYMANRLMDKIFGSAQEFVETQ
jgi:hypothetical protein